MITDPILLLATTLSAGVASVLLISARRILLLILAIADAQELNRRLVLEQAIELRRLRAILDDFTDDPSPWVLDRIDRRERRVALAPATLEPETAMAFTVRDESVARSPAPHRPPPGLSPYRDMARPSDEALAPSPARREVRPLLAALAVSVWIVAIAAVLILLRR